MGAEKVSFKSGWLRLLNTNIGKQKDRSHKRQLSRTLPLRVSGLEQRFVIVHRLKGVSIGPVPTCG
jgi:hypothetical protein